MTSKTKLTVVASTNDRELPGIWTLDIEGEVTEENIKEHLAYVIAENQCSYEGMSDEEIEEQDEMADQLMTDLTLFAIFEGEPKQINV